MAERDKNKPKCPTCGSTNIKKIGGIERGASIAAFVSLVRKLIRLSSAVIADTHGDMI